MACRSGERDEGSKLGSYKLSFGQYDKEWHGHLEITCGNETCPEDAHDASRLNLSLGTRCAPNQKPWTNMVVVTTELTLR